MDVTTTKTDTPTTSLLSNGSEPANTISESLVNFSTALWQSIFTPGTNPELIKAMNLSFIALFLSLLSLLVLSGFNWHVLALLIIASALFASIQWFLVELAKVREAELIHADSASSEDTKAQESVVTKTTAGTTTTETAAMATATATATTTTTAKVVATAQDEVENSEDTATAIVTTIATATTITTSSSSDDIPYAATTGADLPIGAGHVTSSTLTHRATTGQPSDITETSNIDSEHTPIAVNTDTLNVADTNVTTEHPPTQTDEKTEGDNGNVIASDEIEDEDWSAVEREEAQEPMELSQEPTEPPQESTEPSQEPTTAITPAAATTAAATTTTTTATERTL